jgi:predicted DNA-binding mobile mystery protein A
MKMQNSLLVIRQLDKKLEMFISLGDAKPRGGWIRLIRKTLKISLRQVSDKMEMTPQGVRDIENREDEGTITLNTLQAAANALDMKLVYGLIPNDGSLEKLIERKAHELAVKIINRTSTTMKLEGQENSSERINQAIKEMTGELKREMPKNLWD